MATVGYIRVSTFEQNTARQLDGVKLDKSFTEKISGANCNRPELENMIDYIRDGDTVVCHSIDRLARSLIDLHKIVARINGKGAIVRFNTEGLTFEAGNHNPHATLHLSMLGAFAQFERELIKQRQAEGIAKAKERGAYKNCGRPKVSKEIKTQVLELISNGTPKTEIARTLGIARSSVYKISESR